MMFIEKPLQEFFKDALITPGLGTWSLAIYTKVNCNSRDGILHDGNDPVARNL